MSIAAMTWAFTLPLKPSAKVVLLAIADIYMERFGDDSILRTRLASIRSFLGRLDFYEVQEAMEIAVDKMRSRAPAFNYFCGICWRKIKRANGEDI